jgi:choice-of-anchor B domain-containing protein
VQISRRRLVHLVAIAAAVLAMAANPVVQGLFARDGKAQYGMDTSRSQELRAMANAVAPLGPLECTSGFAGPYPCENVDLLGIATIPEIGAGVGSDVWGWYDDDTGREIAIPTTTAGAAFIDVTDPSNPVVLGRMQIGQNDDNVLWRDIKVFEDHAFVVSEHTGTHMYVFDLTQLREVSDDQGFLEPDLVYEEFDNAHNIFINEQTGFAYAVGTNTCEAGLHMVDINDPKNPTFAGCFDEDGYTHDVQCIVYDGPDTRFTGREICFASNEDTLTIVDVTDKSNPVMLSRRGYDSAAYTHQGWLTADRRWFLFGDELDELTQTVGGTTTYMVNVEDLMAPGEIKAFQHGTTAIDHNLYIEDGYVWQANYSAGLRVLSITQEGLDAGDLEPAGFFDVDPGPDAPAFAGAWTAYPFFPSGNVVLNSFDSGMFVLGPTLPAVEGPVDDPAPDPAPEPEPAPEPDDPDEAVADDSQLPTTGGGAALLGLALLGGAVYLYRRR